MPILLYNAAISIDQREGKTTKLCTLSPIGTASETSFRSIALTAIAHAERAMNEGFQWYGASTMYLLYLLER